VKSFFRLFPLFFSLESISFGSLSPWTKIKFYGFAHTSLRSSILLHCVQLFCSDCVASSGYRQSCSSDFRGSSHYHYSATPELSSVKSECSMVEDSEFEPEHARAERAWSQVRFSKQLETKSRRSGKAAREILSSETLWKF
jgi:hypothetical protein